MTSLAVLTALIADRARAQQPEAQPTTPAAQSPPAHPGDPYLVGATLAESETKLTAALQAAPTDDQARYRLGAVQMMRAVEKLSQDLYAYGLKRSWALQFLSPVPPLNIPDNMNPQPIDYEALRKTIGQWVADLATAEKTLGEVKSADVSLWVDLGQVRLDINRDGKSTPEEALAAMASTIIGPMPSQGAEGFVVRFDRADVCWLRGYCHFLMAVGEIFLAYDEHESFERCAHLFFPRAVSPYPFVAEDQPQTAEWRMGPLMDHVAFIHLVNWPVKEPARMQAALEHLQAMVKQSRELWPLAAVETDNDHEWIPGPNQTSVLGGEGMSKERIDGWIRFLDEADGILSGQKLVPFWRGTKPQGVDFHRVFTEPKPFDLVLWLQGTAAAPYLAEGPVTSTEVWNDLQRLFQGQFIGFAFWLN